jgi:transposase
MLKDAISRARKALKEVQQKYSVESAAAVEQVYADIKNLNKFINKEIEIIDADGLLNDRAKSNERRKVLEQAGRKLEILKEKRSKSPLIEDLESKLTDDSGAENQSVLKFLQEREVRDRLYSMPPGQILSHFGKTLFDGSNRLVLEAILNAPPGFEMLSEDTLKKLRETRVQILKPEITAELEKTRRLNTVIEQIFWLVKKELDRQRRKELPATLNNGK